MKSLRVLKRIMATGVLALSCASPVFAMCVGTASSLMTVDSDADGMPDPIETIEARQFCIKDNDVFNKYPLFIKQAYRDFFAREAEASAVYYWDGFLVNGTQTPASLVETFMGTGEFQDKAAPITRLYKAYFNRMPDHEGLWYWVNLFGNGKTLADIAQTFSDSPEFKTQYGSVNNSAFIDLVYQNVLGRAADAAGKAYWLDLLNTGKQSRGEIMIGFSESAEHISDSTPHVHLVLAYEGLLRRNVNASDYAAGMTRLRSGTPIRTILTELMASTEYRLRFMPLLGNVSSTPTGTLNDTGVTMCYQAGNSDLVACNSTAALALSKTQDGMLGRDSNASSNSAADGKLGFSYTKIDMNGNALPATATSWACVKDNVTGLIWENKTDDGGLHDKDNLYSNYLGNLAQGNAFRFVDDVNLEGWCGANDWTLPMVEDLASILDYSRFMPAIDMSYFPNTMSSRFWTASRTHGLTNYAWYVDFDTANFYVEYVRGTFFPIRLVRAH